MNTLDFLDGKIDRITFSQYCAFVIDQFTEIGYKFSDTIEWLLEWSESNRKE